MKTYITNNSPLRSVKATQFINDEIRSLDDVPMSIIGKWKTGTDEAGKWIEIINPNGFGCDRVRKNDWVFTEDGQNYYSCSNQDFINQFHAADSEKPVFQMQKDEIFIMSIDPAAGETSLMVTNIKGDGTLRIYPNKLSAQNPIIVSADTLFSLYSAGRSLKSK